MLDTLAVTDSRGNAVKLTEKGSGKYTFTMPGRSVTVTAVAQGTWYYEAVRFVAENGLMRGFGGVLDPKGLATRAQTASMLRNFLKNG